MGHVFWAKDLEEQPHGPVRVFFTLMSEFLSHEACMKDTQLSLPAQRTREASTGAAGAGSPPPPVKPAAAIHCTNTGQLRGRSHRAGKPTTVRTGVHLTESVSGPSRSMQLRQRSRTQTDTSENKGPGSAVLKRLGVWLSVDGKGSRPSTVPRPQWALRRPQVTDQSIPAEAGEGTGGAA